MEDGSRWAGRRSWTWDACSMVVRTAGAGLRRLAEVAVMQATDFGNLHDPARCGELDGPDVRRILVEREMGARPVIVGEVCVQRRQTCSVGGKSHRGNSQTPRSLDGRAAGNQSSEAHRRNHRKDGSEWPGRNVSERKGSLEKRFRRPSAYFTREGSRDRRSLADATTPLRRGVSDGTAPRTRQATGETLLVPPRNRRSRVGRITGSPGKAADGERVADGPVEAMRRGNARGAKGPCCSATPPTTWKAGAS